MSSPPLDYFRVSESELPEVLTLLLAAESEANLGSRLATIMASLHRGDLSRGAMIGARRAAKLVGAAWGQYQAGNTALLWPPRVLDEAGAVSEVGDRLIELVDAQLEAQGVRMVQAILPSLDLPEAQQLQRRGYQLAAQMLFLSSQLDRLPPQSTAGNLDFVPYRIEDRSRMEQVVERTYIDTADVPALGDARDIQDVLDGYEQIGDFSPERWFFVRQASRDVGCLLLTDHPSQEQWELVYMGLVPAARGQGAGLPIVRFSQRMARQAGRGRLVLAVDGSNDPAIATYAKAGFMEWCRRCVLLKIFAA